MNIPSILNKAKKLWPAHKAVVCGEHRFSYQEFTERCYKLAGVLIKTCPSPGDRIAILNHNCHTFLEAYYAAAIADLIIVPINTRLSHNELKFILNDSGSKVLIINSDLEKTLATVVSENIDHLKLETLIWIKSIGNIKSINKNFENLNYEDAMVDEKPESKLPNKKFSEIAQLYYTSGTTGKPKGVILTHDNVVTHAMGAVKELQLSTTDVWGHIAPMYHLADAWATFAITMVGGTHVLVPRFEPGLVLKNISDNSITISNLIPTMLNRLVNYPKVKDFDISSLRCLLSGGAPIAPELVKKIIKTFKCEYIQTYGMTETSPYLTVSILKDHLKQLPEPEKLKYISKTGRPFINVDLKVVDESGNEVNRNDKAVGEIWVSGPTISPGYWNNPEETAAAFQDGWLKTGDLAVIDPEGYVNIVDRKKDMILTGGENVYSTEVEHVLYEHPGILEAAVIGVPDDKWGEAVKAVVVLKNGIIIDPDEIIDFCKARLAHFKVPKSVDFMMELPKTGTGKVAKSMLREKYWHGFNKNVH